MITNKPMVGDRVTHPDEPTIYEVTAVGRGYFLGDAGDDEQRLNMSPDQPWVLLSRPALGSPPWDVIPEALGDEDGETYFWQGHIAPPLAVLSLVVERALNWHADEAIAALLGPPLAGNTWDQRVAHASELVRNVEHYWAREVPGRDTGERCEAGNPGAEPWTMLRLR